MARPARTSLFRAVSSGAKGAAFGLAIIVVTSTALGWLYLVRQYVTRWPGPRVVDALPLDELPHHANVPIAIYLAAFLLGGAVLGAIARAATYDRLLSSLITWVVGSAFVFFETAFSIFVVRQESFHASLLAARSVEAVYLGPALLAIGAALFARDLRRAQVYPTLCAIAVAVLGTADVIGGIFPSAGRHDSIDGLFAHGSTAPLERTFVILSGLLLALAARAIDRRSRPAWTVAVGLAAMMLGLRFAAGFDGPLTIFGVFVLLVLLARRRDFIVRSDPTRKVHLLGRLLGMFALAFAFGIVSLSVNRTAADLPFHLLAASRTTLFAFSGATPRGARVIAGHFGQWFPWTVLAIAASGVAWAAAGLFAPWRARFSHDAVRWRLAREVVRASGTDSLAPFVLRADKDLYLHAPGGALSDPSNVVLIAYRVVRDVAIVSGDPVGPEDHVDDALVAFRSFVQSRGWRLAVLGVSERFLDRYRRAGMRVLYHGDEAVIPVEGFDLGGNAKKSVRQAHQRIAHRGYTVQILAAGDVAPAQRAELVHLEREWLEFTPPKGFVMQLDELFRLDGDDALFVVARDECDSVAGFLEFAVCHASRTLSLSSMPRRASAPNGLNAFLIVEAIRWAGANGFHAVSLNFSPFARLFEEGVRLGLPGRVLRFVLRGAKALLPLQLDNLYRFNMRFRPEWQPRYLAYEQRRHLARIVIAAMAAERYLPFADLLRGRDWAGASKASRAARDARSHEEQEALLL